MKNQQDSPGVNLRRRRLTKAGLAAPAVLGTLASRPVLGEAPHYCTPSGYISGFASAIPGGGIACSSLGKPPSYYADGPSTWPDGLSSGSYFINNRGGVRAFKNSPNGIGLTFVDAYQVRKISGGDNPPIGTIQNASVWDVLAGCNVVANPDNQNYGSCNTNWVLESRPGYESDLTVVAEAVAALMNAIAYAPNFPISPLGVVEMSNSVLVADGLDPVTDVLLWNAAEVQAYFQSLHS